ncbi:hypothetical protein HGRIS_002730 [Hohenbuehelia grisea]|uniref:Uncharacterized protein n=1 Tax=Hohenbuehelia grisea TaxID=104357 RepID=A0ABR3JNG7_9AGAR
MRRKRLSGIADDDDTVFSSAGVFANSCSPEADKIPAIVKRRRTGLNSRFDRMVEEMNVTDASITGGRVKVHSRSRSSGSSSIGSHEFPKTPIDAYNNLQEGRLGGSFSVIKMTRSYDASRILDDAEASPDSESSEEPVLFPEVSKPGPLPAWLADTFKTLNSKHPLRALLPTSRQHSRPRQAVNVISSIIPENTSKDDEPIFAFTPMSPRQNEEETRPGCSLSPSSETSAISSPPSQSTGGYISTPHEPIQSVDHFMPFATAGPASTISYSDYMPTEPIPLGSPQLDEGLDSSISSNFLSLSQVPFRSPAIPEGARNVIQTSFTSPRGDTMLSPAHQDSPALHHAALPALRCYSQSPTLLIETAARIPDTISDDITPPHFEESAETSPTRASILPNIHSALFSAPGPGYRAYDIRTMLLESRTDDPLSSDPSQLSEYHPDYYDVDFHWKPFLRNGDSDPSRGVIHQAWDRPLHIDIEGLSAKRTIQSPLHLARPPQVDEDILPPSTPRSATPASEFPYPDEEFDERTPQDSQNTTKMPEPTAPVFAPAPGIFISPLRDVRPSESEDEENIGGALNEEGVDGHNVWTSSDGNSPIGSGSRRSMSQSSHDSIESWDDNDEQGDF